ncbi:hypothetical protein MyNCGM683_06630 [Achromobacter xylosoxidans]
MNIVTGYTAKLPAAVAALSGPYMAPPVRDLPSGAISEQRLRDALHDHEFRAYFQPQVDLESMCVTGLEVLARWVPPNAGVISPAVFLPLLERIGALDDMLFGLVEQAAGLLQGLERSDIGLSFNVSPVQLVCPSFARRFQDVLRTWGHNMKKITVELTEDCPIVDLQISGKNLMDLKRAGCRLAMDDYGKGYSSLTRLVKLPFDEIKLDASFSANDTYCLPIVQNALALARSLNLSLVVEGIEHADLHEKLVALGCPLGQGYFYGAPADALAISAILSRWVN